MGARRDMVEMVESRVDWGRPGAGYPGDGRLGVGEKAGGSWGSDVLGAGMCVKWGRKVPGPVVPGPVVPGPVVPVSLDGFLLLK